MGRKGTPFPHLQFLGQRVPPIQIVTMLGKGTRPRIGGPNLNVLFPHLKFCTLTTERSEVQHLIWYGLSVYVCHVRESPINGWNYRNTLHTIRYGSGFSRTIFNLGTTPNDCIKKMHPTWDIENFVPIIRHISETMQDMKYVTIIHTHQSTHLASCAK